MINNKDCGRIIEVYEAFIDERVRQPETFWDDFTGILYDSEYTPIYRPECGCYLKFTNEIKLFVKRKNWLLLETSDSFIALGYDGVTFHSKCSEFMDSFDYMQPAITIDDYEEIDELERLYLLGESIKDVYEKDGHYFVQFVTLVIEIVPLEDNDEIPLDCEFKTYRHLCSSERLIRRKCSCGGTGRILMGFPGDYVVRCDNCNKATEITAYAKHAIEMWEKGDVGESLNDIVIK